MANEEQVQNLKTLKETTAGEEAEGTPLFVPDLKALGLIIPVRSNAVLGDHLKA